MKRRETTRHIVAAMAAAALVMSLAGCGIRVSRDEVIAANSSGLRPTDAAPAVPGQLSHPAGDAASAGASPQVVEGQPATPESGRSRATGPGAATPTGAASPSGSSPAPAQRAAAAGGGAAPAPSGDRAAAPAQRPAGTPIVIGSVGTLSGPAGTALAGGPAAVQAWARSVNSRGGLDGHRVEVIVVDDGADPARYRAAVRDLVESRGVFAFVSNMAAFTLSAARDYLEQKRVPVIGGDLSSPMWHTSPMFFPQAGGELTQIYGVVANAAQTGKKRFASLTCQEAQGCRDADHYWHDEGYAAQVGLQPVYRAQVSIAQPDYTAECLGAQRAGAEILAVVVDAASILRVARSCDRQGYRPLFTMAGASTEEKLASENTGPLDGALTAVITFPWVLSDTPATAEFNTAMRRYAPNTPLTATTSQGWTSAKLFERAATGLGPNPDRERLLDNLWRLRGETLGGLTAPLTFVREKPNPDAGCWFVMRVAGRQWTAPAGAKPLCRAVK